MGLKQRFIDCAKAADDAARETLRKNPVLAEMQTGSDNGVLGAYINTFVDKFFGISKTCSFVNNFFGVRNAFNRAFYNGYPDSLSDLATLNKLGVFGVEMARHVSRNAGKPRG